MAAFLSHIVTMLLIFNIRTIANDFINSSSESTLARIKWFIDIERRPRTENEVYYVDFREKFLGHYKGWRPQDGQSRMSLTQRIVEAAQVQDPNFRQALTDTLSGLTRMGLRGMDATELGKLLPPDEYESAIEIMASVRAYFQSKRLPTSLGNPTTHRGASVVAYKRFTDNIPMAIDYELVLGLDRDQALEKALRKGLGIGSPDALAQCAEYIREPRNTAERREELMKKRERLEMARRELSTVWL